MEKLAQSVPVVYIHKRLKGGEGGRPGMFVSTEAIFSDLALFASFPLEGKG